MKNIIKMLSVSIIALFSFAMIVDAKVKETDNYTEDTYIIGYSRFSGNDAITADMAAKSGQYYERIYYSMNWDFPDDVTVYLKSELDGEWYTAKDGKPLTDKETNLLTENLLVFFVNGVEKTYEVPFSGAVDEGSLTKGVTFSNGKFTVPAYKFEFYFESNNAEVYAYVPYEWDDDEVEYDFGEFEFIVQEPPKDIKETIVSQSNTIKNTYYNKQSNVTITDVVDDYYVNVGEYIGETEVDYITLNGYHYYQGDEGSLSVGLNSFIKTPIWKIVEGNVLVALPWLAAGSLPNGSTYIYLYDANENSLKSFNLSTYPSDENKTLSFASSTALFTKDGFTNKIEQSVDLNGEPQFSYTSGYGTQGFGVLINDSEGNPITDENQIIFRQSTNDSMAITFPEYNNTYVTIPKYQNGAYNSSTDEHFYYKLAIPGKGVIDLNFILNTIQEPLNINSAMVSQAETIKTTYYNKYTKQTITDVNSAYYVNVGKYQGNETPTLLTIAGNEYSSDYIGSLSIGRNSFIEAPVWKIDKNNNVLVALPWLASDSLPNGATSINVNGYELLVTTYPSDEDKILSINRVDVLFAKEGQTALIENIGENYYRFTSSYGTQAYGVIINDTNGNPIIDKNQIIFRKSQNGDMGLTFPDTVNGVVYAYASYPYYVEGVYTSEQGYNYDYKLAIPGKGVINFNLDLITIAAPKDLSQKMVEVSDAFKSTFYNKYNQEVVEINDELFSSYYVEIGEYNGLENPEVLTIAGVDYYAEDYKEISIGNNAIVRTPVWVIKEDKLYIALPWLAVESLPGGITTVNVGGQSIKLKTYPSDDGKYIEIASADVLFAVDGYMSNLSFNNGIFTYVSGHGHQALGFKFNDINGNLITEEQLIFRKSVNGSMGVTIPETLNGSVYTYALYPKWNDGEYLETSSQLLDYRLAIPGYGVTDLKINFVAFTNN